MEHADELHTAPSTEGAVEQQVTIRDERADMGTKFGPAAAHSRATGEHARHVPQSHDDPASSLGIVPGDMVTNVSKVLQRLGCEDEAGHL